MKKRYFSILASLIFSTWQLFAAANTEKVDSLIAHVEKSIELAERNISKLTPEILSIEGMSSNKVRCLLNNLCSLQGTSYLEIGVWKGSTFVSALYGNGNALNEIVGIDNWSEFEGPRREFQNNCTRFVRSIPYKFYSADCFTIDPKAIIHQPINIYFYDGAHDALSQELALTYYDAFFDDVFILVVDDWNHIPAQQGTLSGLKKLNYKVLYEKALPARFNCDRENWWNGLYVAVISKN